MYASYLIIAFRNIARNPLISAIKIISLALGLSASVLVLMYTNYVNNYDKSFDNWENIYRLSASTRADFNSAPEPYAERFALDYPQIDKIAKIRPENGLFTSERESYQLPFFWVDPQIIELFSLEFESGAPQSALLEPNSLVINQNTAQLLFGEEDPIGKRVTYNGIADLMVTGVVRNVPENSYFDFSAMITVQTGRGIFGEGFMGGNNWIVFAPTQTYFSVRSSSDAQAIYEDRTGFLERNIPEQTRAYATESNLRLNIEPLADVFMSPLPGYNSGGYERKAFFYAINAFGMLVLVASCINVISLSISQIKSRAKEIGVRRTIGAVRSQLAVQFVVESLFFTALAFIVAAPIVILATPAFENFTYTSLSFGHLAGSASILWVVSSVIAVGVLCGLVPATVLSRIQPNISSTGRMTVSRRGSAARSAITTVQFFLSNTFVLLAIATYVLIDYLNEMDLGYSKDDLVVMAATYNPRSYGDYNYEALANEMSQHPGVLSVAKSSSAPPAAGGRNPWRRAEWPADRTMLLSNNAVDVNYIDALQLKVIAGRGYSRDFPSDIIPATNANREQVYGVVLTRSGVTDLEFQSMEEAVGSVLEFNGMTTKVIGVVEDFRLSGGMENSASSIRALWATDQKLQYFILRLDPAQISSATRHIEEVWSRHRPNEIVNMTFLEQAYGSLIEQRTAGVRIASIFSAITTIVIAFLGLFALAFYTAQRRTKEIGIRSVLGATPELISMMILVDFLKPVAIACVFSSVAGHYAVNYLYSYFSSRPDFSISIYVMVSLCTIALAAVAVMSQCYRMAMLSPVKSLRYE
ncbi:MAG: ABC transporter permease [Gammaproteobacteria bacterium]|nr:ABC transporter permease [Gammaproteobacteria bacterium]